MSLLILGHSFVDRLHANRDELSKSMSATFHHVSIKDRIRGGTVECLRKQLSDAERTSPSVVLLDVGSNELSSPSLNPRRLACEIGELARLNRQLPSVKTVVVMPIQPRVVVNCRHPTRPDFNDARLVVNRAVADICCHFPGVFTWRQRCFRLHPERFICSDGVHPTFLGLRKYMNEIRRASLFGARQSAP